MTTVGFALEYSLGHTTHAENLKHFLFGGNALAGNAASAPMAVRPHYVDLPYDGTPVGRWGRMPGVRSNWTVRASLGAYLGMRRLVTQMASGLPVITTNVAALPEVIGYGEAGMVVEPNDPAGLAGAIATLAHTPNLRAHLGRRARELAVERYDAQRNYARLITVLVETAGPRNSYRGRTKQ